MSFTSTVGSTISFFILITIFIGSFTLYQIQVNDQLELQNLNSKNSFFSTLSESIGIFENYYSSGRLQLKVQNNGDNKLYFISDNNYCFSFFSNNKFLSENDSKFNIVAPIDNYYTFIDSGDYGIFSAKLDESILLQNNSFKLISCGENENSININSDEFNWWNLNFESRKEINLYNSYSQPLLEYQYEVNLNNSNFDFSDAREESLRFLLPYKETYILDLPFDDYSQNLNEYSKYNNNPVLGDTSFSESSDPGYNNNGVMFGSLNFDGIDDRVLVNGDSSFFINDFFTISSWVKWNGAGNLNQKIFYDSLTNSSVEIINDGSSLDGKIRININNSTSIISLVSDSRLDSKWNYLTISYDGSNLSLYYNSILENTTVFSNSPNIDLSSSIIGSMLSSDYLNGSIDEFRILNIGLNSSEVIDLYHNNLRFKMLDFYISKWSYDNEEAKIFVKVPNLYSNDNVTIQLYYSTNNSYESYSNIETTFSYSKPRVVGYILNDEIAAQVGASIMSLYDNNEIYIGNDQFFQDKYNVNSLGIANIARNDSVRLKYLAQVESDSNEGDIFTPISWASTTFVNGQLSDTIDTFCMISPWGTANVDIYIDGVLNDGFTLDNAATCYVNDVPDTSGLRIEADIPILVSYFGDSGDDEAYTFYPATSDELFGIPSNTMVMGSGNAQVQTTEFGSDGSFATRTIAPNDDALRGAMGIDALSPALRVKPLTGVIAAAQENDGDGNERTVFVPEYEMGVLFGSGEATEHIVLASPHSNANCSTYDNGVLVDTNYSGSGTNGIYKYGFDIGDDTQYIGSGWSVECEKSVWGYYERDAGNKETNIVGHLQIRQYVYPEPIITIN